MGTSAVETLPPTDIIKEIMERTASGHEADTSTVPADGYKFNSPMDKEHIKLQRQAIWDMLRHLGSHILSQGINLTNISLPVQVFEPRSFLERITDSWAYLDLIEAAANAPDAVERLKYVAGFVIGGLRRQTSTLKPFNPILGETYQAEYPSGAQVFAEQTSHHPPVSSWQVLDKRGKWQFYGNASWQASARGNAIRGQQAGRNAVWFARDGATVAWELPQLHLKGILWGERVLKYTGSITFRDLQNGLTCEVSSDALQAQGVLSYLWKSKSKRSLPDQIRGELKQHDQIIDTVSGSWLRHVDWDKGVSIKGLQAKRVWDVSTAIVRQPEQILQPLPSDSRHREDLQKLRAGEIAAAGDWKTKLEEAQRQDKHLRKQGHRSFSKC